MNKMKTWDVSAIVQEYYCYKVEAYTKAEAYLKASESLPSEPFDFDTHIKIGGYHHEV